MVMQASGDCTTIQRRLVGPASGHGLFTARYGVNLKDVDRFIVQGIT